MPNKTWKESQPGRTSAMRVMVVPGFYIGSIMAIVSTAGLFLKLCDMYPLIIWTGFALTCGGLKKFQKDKEVNENQL